MFWASLWFLYTGTWVIVSNRKRLWPKWMLGHSLLNIYKSDLSLISLIWSSTDLKTDYKAIFADNIQCERYPIFVYCLCSYTAKVTIYLPESRIRIACDTFELDAMPTPSRPRELATKGPDTWKVDFTSPLYWLGNVRLMTTAGFCIQVSETQKQYSWSSLVK